MKSFSIELIEVIVHKCSKKRCFRNIGGTYKKTPAAKYNFRQQGVIWLLCLQALKPKNAQENCAFDVLDVHRYALCVFISCLFSSGMKFGVRKFRDLIDFGLHCSLRVSLILLYFTSIRAWVENLRIKNCIKNLMVVMPSYFYKDNMYKTSRRRPF